MKNMGDPPIQFSSTVEYDKELNFEMVQYVIEYYMELFDELTLLIDLIL